MNDENTLISENRSGNPKNPLIYAKLFIILSFLTAGFILARAIHFYIVGIQSLVFGYVPYHFAIFLLPLYLLGIVIRRVWSFYITFIAFICWIFLFLFLAVFIKHFLYFFDEGYSSLSFIDFEIRFWKFFWLWALSVVVLFLGLIGNVKLLEQKYGRKVLSQEKGKRKHKIISLPELLVIVAIVATLLGVLLPALAHITLIDPKPKLPPQESNRIYHPRRFSIIAPKDWIYKTTTEPNNLEGIFIYPKNAAKARFSPRFAAILYPNREDVNNRLNRDGFEKGKYLQFDAMVFEGLAGNYHRWEAIFTKDEKWYGVELMLPHGKDSIRYEKVPNYWWPFINSFRIEPNE